MKYRAAFPFACLLAASCSSAPSGPVTGITISTGDLVPAFSPNVFVYEVSSLTTMFPVSITVTGQDVKIDGEQAKDGVAFQKTISALDDTTTIAIDARDAQGNPVTYRIHTAPQTRPRYDITTLASPTPGQILLAPNQVIGATGGPSFIYVLDETGRLEFYKASPFNTVDFERYTLPNGAIRYAYIMMDAPLNQQTWPVEQGTIYVLDDHFQQMQTIRLAAAGSHPAYGADIHEFKLLDDDHWILESYIDETVTNVPGYASSGVVSGIVQEVKGGQVLFDWETTSVPAFYTQSTDGNDYTDAKAPYADYNHLNALDLDPSNGNPVVSLRHDDEIAEIDRGTGAIVWTLGGLGDQFNLAAADKSSHQHYLRFLEPNHIIMFDNGNASSVSRVREYQIDPVGHTAQALAAYGVDTHYSFAMGSAQKIAGRYFIGWGYRRAGESDVTEIDPATNTKSFELSFHDGYCSYRALKY